MDVVNIRSLVLKAQSSILENRFLDIHYDGPVFVSV